MKGNRAIVAAVVVFILLIVGWWLFRRGRGAESVDLVQAFGTATKRPTPDIFSVADVTLNGETMKGIAIQPAPGSRIIWKVRVPEDGWLKVALGLKPEAWTQEGNGVRFYVGVSDGRTYEPLFEQHVNPFANQGDRKWIPIMVDISAYAGEEVDVIFNTNAANADIRADHAVWAEPTILVR